jgi:hypothetical protein
MNVSLRFRLPTKFPICKMIAGLLMWEILHFLFDGKFIYLIVYSVRRARVNAYVYLNYCNSIFVSVSVHIPKSHNNGNPPTHSNTDVSQSKRGKM